MTSDDLDEFCTLWNNMYANFDRGKAPDGVLTTAFNSLKEYDFKDVAEIVRQALENCERLPALATIKKGLDRLTGRDVKSLKVKALEQWRLVNSYLIMGHDLAIEDCRACYALQTCFGSLTALSKQKLNDYLLTKAEENFVKTYATVEHVKTLGLNHVFLGAQNRDSARIIKFIGDPEKCLAYAHRDYPIFKFPNPQIEFEDLTPAMKSRMSPAVLEAYQKNRQHSGFSSPVDKETVKADTQKMANNFRYTR